MVAMQSSMMTMRPQPCLRLAMSLELIKKYRATALAIEQPPWNLHRAAFYLRQWCDQNEAGPRVEVGKIMMAKVTTLQESGSIPGSNIEIIVI